MPVEEAGGCPVCGSVHLMVCYGLALGGLGPYGVCEECDTVVFKHVTEPGTCLHGLGESPEGPSVP